MSPHLYLPACLPPPACCWRACQASALHAHANTVRSFWQPPTLATRVSCLPSAPTRFEYAVERMALRSRLGGEARLQQAICLGAPCLGASGRLFGFSSRAELSCPHAQRLVKSHNGSLRRTWSCLLCRATDLLQHAGHSFQPCTLAGNPTLPCRLPGAQPGGIRDLHAH